MFAADVDRSDIYMSSIVAMELRAGCRTRSQNRNVDKFLRPFEVAGRVVPPSHSACLKAGATLAELGMRFGFDASRVRRITNDVNGYVQVSASAGGGA